MIKLDEIVKKLNEDVVAINLASMFGGMPQSYQERATCYKAAADLIEGLIPKPIKDARKDGTWLLARASQSSRWHGRWFVIRCVMIDTFEDWQQFPGYGAAQEDFDIFIPLVSIIGECDGK